MRYAKIDSGQIVDVILADERPGEGYVPDAASVAIIGGAWSEAGGFSPPPPGPAPVPDSVEMWQARAALKIAGKYDDADAAIAASGDPVLIEAWTNGNTFRRASPAIAHLGALLGLSEQQIDDLFRLAASISV